MAYDQKTEPGVTVEKYTALEAAHQDLFKDFGKAQSRIQILEQRNTDNDRRNRISALHTRFPSVDVEEECKLSLYSLESTWTDEQFDSHLATVEKYVEKGAKEAAYIPDGEAPHEDNAPERYAQDQAVNTEAVKIHGEALQKGEHMSYNEARAEAVKRLSA